MKQLKAILQIAKVGLAAVSDLLWVIAEVGGLLCDFVSAISSSMLRLSGMAERT